MLGAHMRVTTLTTGSCDTHVHPGHVLHQAVHQVA